MANWSSTYTLNFGEKILYGFLFAVLYVLSLIPMRGLYLLSDFLYLIIYKGFGYRTKVVRKNLRNSFPDKTEAERKKIEQGFYHFLCDYIVETIKLMSISKEEMKRRVEFDDLEKIRELVREGKSVAAYLGHYCNWEWITSMGLHFGDECKLGEVYHVLQSRVMDKLMLHLRNRMGTENIPMAEVLRRIITIKKEGNKSVIGFISDQAPILYNVPHWIEFLHQQTPFITGTERLAKKLDMACVYFDVQCPKRGHYRLGVKVLVKDTKDIPDWKITEMYAREMEKTIKRQPQYWLWSHNRWKRKPEDYKNALK